MSSAVIYTARMGLSVLVAAGIGMSLILRYLTK